MRKQYKPVIGFDSTPRVQEQVMTLLWHESTDMNGISTTWKPWFACRSELPDPINVKRVSNHPDFGMEAQVLAQIVSHTLGDGNQRSTAIDVPIAAESAGGFRGVAP